MIHFHEPETPWGLWAALAAWVLCTAGALSLL
jgi:hypothetical protein